MAGKLKKFVKKLITKNDSGQKTDGFFLNVRCGECGEEFNLFINKSWELSQNFETERAVSYFLRKEIIGFGCKNRIHVKMDFDGAKNLLSKEIENGEFIEK